MSGEPSMFEVAEAWKRSAELEQEVASLRRRVAELEAEIARLHATEGQTYG